MATTPPRKLEVLEEKLMEDMVNDIGGSDDPVDQFKAIERYHKLILARKDRLQGEASAKNCASWAASLPRFIREQGRGVLRR